MANLTSRTQALDWLRGLVMILMTFDHASEVFNAGRLLTDSMMLYRPGTPLPTAQFLARWITHLCAPAFVFLAGAGLALSIARRQAAGEPPATTDRFILTRGLLIAALDPLWMSWALTPGYVVFQVLYAIGAGLACMVALRRLPARWLLGLALGLVLGGEALTGIALAATGGELTLPVALLLTGGQFPSLIVAYPLLPWLAIMLFGWCFGLSLHAGAPRAARLLTGAGLAALLLFAVVRGLNGYGNMLLLRDDGSLVQWLHVSKYPPSLSFAALELGLVALCLGALLHIGRRAGEGPAWLRPLLVLGQTALFFYLIHIHVLVLAATMLGQKHSRGLGAALLASLGTIVLLYPACAWYRRYKLAHPHGWARYV